MVKPPLIPIVIVFNDVTSKSREQRLITKELIATRTILVLLFKPIQYFSYKLFKKLFCAEILIATL